MFVGLAVQVLVPATVRSSTLAVRRRGGAKAGTLACSSGTARGWGEGEVRLKLRLG